MIAFYNLPLLVITSCTGSIILTVIFAILTRRRKFETFVPLFGFLQLSFLVLVVLFVTIGYRIQVSIALSSVQQSLDNECGQNIYQAEETGLNLSSGFHWTSDDKSAECYYSSKNGWVCNCKK